jgi:hypothetical protein
MVVCIGAAGLLAAAACGGGGGGGGGQPPPTTSHRVGGTVTGLAGAGLQLGVVVGDHPVGHGGADQTVDVPAPGAYTFPNAIASGTRYQVTVQRQPTSPAQNCQIAAAGSGTIAGADVTNADVTCTTSQFTVGGTVTGFAPGLSVSLNGGAPLAITADGAFTFPGGLPSGSQYAVAVQTQPAAPRRCDVLAPSSGTVTAANITNVRIRCSDTTVTIGGTVSGLADGSSVVLQNGLGHDLTVSGNQAFTFQPPIVQGAEYSVAVKTQPASQHCEVANRTGTATANVTNVAVTCGPVLQRWQAPTTWGALWPDSPTMVQHAYFDGTGIVSAKGPQLAWSAGAPPSPAPASGFPASTNRFGVGPYTGAHYRGAADAALAALNGDMIVCAVVKPDYDPSTLANGQEKTIVAKGIANGTESVAGGGWVLMQMHHHFCFHYQSTDGTTSRMTMAATPTYFADNDQPRNGPLNPSYVVVCGGRAGGNIVIAANSYADESHVAALPAPANVLDAGAHPLTIGGAPTGAPEMAFGGRVYETAVWNEPATPENVQAKLAQIQGLTLPDASVARYSRNREAGFQFASLDDRYHTVWRSGPRIDPAKGLLFGLQGFNRVVTTYVPSERVPSQDNPSWFIATSESLEAWTPAAGATVQARQIVPPGDSEQPTAALVTLPPGASISTPLQAFDAAGPIHGQVWLRVPATTPGTIAIEVTAPAAGGSGRFDIDLATVPADAWRREWLYRAPGGPGNELTTDGSQGVPGNVLFRNTGTTQVQFYAWGLDLTQIGGGGTLGALDPGPQLHDGSLRINDWTTMVDVLHLPPLASSTAATGYCLSVDAQPGLTWQAPFARRRVLAAWVSDSDPSRRAELYSEAGGTNLCFGVTGAVFDPCFPPSTWLPGSTHNLKGCVDASGVASIYADDQFVGNVASGASVVDLNGGHLRVGGGEGFGQYPWNGYVSKVLTCFNGGAASNAANCQ